MQLLSSLIFSSLSGKVKDTKQTALKSSVPGMESSGLELVNSQGVAVFHYNQLLPVAREADFKDVHNWWGA